MQTIFHIIDTLNRGGAETLLLEVVKNLKQYNNYIITLTNENDFSEEETAGMKIISLKFTSFKSLPSTVLRLKRLIAAHKPSIIHAHLPLSSFVARLVKPANARLFISVHNKYSESLKAVSRKMFLLEKLLHSGNESLIFVSASIKADYEKIIGIKGKSVILYNFIADKFFEQVYTVKSELIPKPIRLVAVGSFKYQKNFDTLLEAFSILDASNFSLDIYGDGPEKVKLENIITQYKLNNVSLKGAVADIEKQLPQYDAFVLASRYEGFGLAPLEAAVSGLPLLLSDIEVFREVTESYATFFSPHKAEEIAKAIQEFKEGYSAACKKAAGLRTIVKEKYAKPSYMKQLQNIYIEQAL